MLPSGEQIAIAHGDERAVITEVGATLRTFVKGGVSVIEGFAGEEVPTGARGQVLYPWPNRMGDGEWTFSERIGASDHRRRRRTPRPSTGSCAGDRFASTRSTRTAARSPVTCTRRRTIPFLSEINVTYHLGRLGLTVTTTVTNRDDVPIPFGVGFHPYLAVTTPTIEGAELEIPATAYVAVNDRQLPTGEILPVAGQQLRLHDAQVGERPRARHDLHRTGARRLGTRDGACWRTPPAARSS